MGKDIDVVVVVPGEACVVDTKTGREKQSPLFRLQRVDREGSFEPVATLGFREAVALLDMLTRTVGAAMGHFKGIEEETKAALAGCPCSICAAALSMLSINVVQVASIPLSPTPRPEDQAPTGFGLCQKHGVMFADGGACPLCPRQLGGGEEG